LHHDRQINLHGEQSLNPSQIARSISGRSAVLAFAVVTASTVAGAAESPKAASPAAAKVEAATLRVDWLASTHHAPFYLGVAKGWYRQAGIDLTIREGRGSGSVIQLVGNNSDTFGFAGAEAVVRGVQNNIPVVSVATIMPKNAFTMFALTKTGVARPQDLKGKTIASTPGSTSDVLLPAFLAAAGLKVGDVTIVPVDPALKTQAVLLGKADAAPELSWAASLFAPGGGVAAFPYAEYGVQVVGYGILTNAETVKDNPDLVKRFVAVTLRAWDYALKYPEEAMSALEQASEEQAKSEAKARTRLDLPQVLKLVRPAVPGKPFGTQSESDWETMQKQLIEYRVVKESRPVSQYLTNRFIP
jgi:NitT/TauT family transport system substrate-binding protein